MHDITGTITIEDLKNFTYNVYVALLKTLTDRYEIIPCSKVNHTLPPFIMIRHDVDGSLESALKMARIENEMGVTATYFVLLSHKLYNVFEESSICILKEIIKLGHEIGLHYDPEALKECYALPHILIDKQIEILSLVLGTRIDVVARHKNSLNVISDPFIVTPYLNRGPSQILNMGESHHTDLTVKDSCRKWVDKYVKKLFSFEYVRVQLIIHPFLWQKDEMEKTECMRRLFDITQQNNEQYRKGWLDLWERISDE